MRTRKPCVFLRRLLLGWNVRFPFIPVPVCAHTATDSKPGHGLKQPPEASRPSIRPITLAPPDGNPNTSRRSLGVSTCRLPQRLHGRLRHPAAKHAEFPEKVASSHIPGDTVLQSPVSVGAAPRPTSGHPFGSFPKISTPVENIVEKRNSWSDQWRFSPTLLHLSNVLLVREHDRIQEPSRVSAVAP
jgi:hypothetical protein